MKKFILLVAFIISTSTIWAQEGHKINLGLDMSYGPHYFSGKANNPIVASGSIGYEYNPIFFFGIEVGFRYGGFNQKVGYEDKKDVYRGNIWAPYIAPKIYLPISYNEKSDRACYVYLENKLSYTRTNLNLDKIGDMEGSAHRNRVTYELKGGYQYPISNKWALNCWLGYNTFNFSKAKPEVIKFKNSTPLQIGLGFSYLIKE